MSISVGPECMEYSVPALLADCDSPADVLCVVSSCSAGWLLASVFIIFPILLVVSVLFGFIYTITNQTLSDSCEFLFILMIKIFVNSNRDDVYVVKLYGYGQEIGNV